MPTLLLIDIGNTHTHLGLSVGERIVKQANIATHDWFLGPAKRLISEFVGHKRLRGSAVCSVVPGVTPLAQRTVETIWGVPCLELNSKTVKGVGLDYPKPRTIGPDRLANAVAAVRRFGAPAVVVDFGTAVTFDVLNPKGNYVGGIIAPGLSAMTEYLHDRTALLPRIKIREVASPIGKSTEEAMLVGAVHGYRGLIRELIQEVKQELGVRRLPVVATGGYAKLIAGKLPAITAVDPLLTLEGLRLSWLSWAPLTKTPTAKRRSS